MDSEAILLFHCSNVPVLDQHGVFLKADRFSIAPIHSSEHLADFADSGLGARRLHNRRHEIAACPGNAGKPAKR
jgi:hypothetical protein